MFKITMHVICYQQPIHTYTLFCYKTKAFFIYTFKIYTHKNTHTHTFCLYAALKINIYNFIIHKVLFTIYISVFFIPEMTINFKLFIQLTIHTFDLISHTPSIDYWHIKSENG